MLEKKNLIYFFIRYFLEKEIPSLIEMRRCRKTDFLLLKKVKSEWIKVKN